MNRIYYKILERDGRLEYHVSSIREEAAKGEALSKAIDANHPNAETCKQQWLDEVRLYGSLPA